MKNWKVFTIIFATSSFLIACKGSKCDCPSFKPKSEVIMDSPVQAAETILLKFA